VVSTSSSQTVVDFLDRKSNIRPYISIEFDINFNLQHRLRIYQAV
jgi:hypothetical protein